MYKFLSPRLYKKYDLWLWDWDDTIIDTKTYYINSMEPEDIVKRSIKELDNEIPNWRFFKVFVQYLVASGKKVGIVSFGTYKIIKAYMDLLFGMNQKIFTNKNLIALCRDINGVPTEYYPNKNSFISKVMDFYKIYDYENVIFLTIE